MNPSSFILICWIIFVVFWLLSSFWAKKNASGSGLKQAAGYRLLIIIIVILALRVPGIQPFFLRFNFVPSSPIFGIIGAALCACGIAFAIWARVYLGKNWGMPMTLKQDPELVTSGPYAFVRHPIYTGMIVALLGSALVSGTLWLGLVIIWLFYFGYASTMEEKLMARQFPDQYPEYKKRTKRLVPFVF